jgi:uncharacterized protein (TIGR00297 family)
VKSANRRDPVDTTLPIHCHRTARTPTIVILGGLAAALVAAIAVRSGALSPGGGVAATVVGWSAAAAGLDWAILLVAYFVVTSSLSLVGREAKRGRTVGLVAKGDRRDATQVLANGGIFAVAALGAVRYPDVALWTAIGGGALAASAADSWGTEIGLLSRTPPRSILTFAEVAAGESGGVTLLGLGATVAGAAWVTSTATLVDWPTLSTAATLIGGLTGAIADSLIGAAVQARRWCDGCAAETEQTIHRCGARTVHRRGWRWMTNDAVNLAATATGAATAAIVARFA